MTLPDERFRAVLRTREFLVNLCNPKHTPRVPKIIREEALWCLRHYPNYFDMTKVSETSSDIFQEKMEPVTKLFKQYEQSKADNDNS
jgi:hypothetical protein